ncbi:hypothetical protein BHE74_00036110 [Ensete ventricosum]|nr:hypothetical protein BHE74_00036110 [Ensete ventricosum]
MHCAYHPVPVPYRYRDELGTLVRTEDYDDHNMEENVDYGYGEVCPETINLEVGCKGAKVEEVEPCSPDSDEAGDMNVYVVGMSCEYSDGEDWIVVGEI